jgi:hypothetical protein
MNKRILTEELGDIKYLFGYKSGKVISEQFHPDSIKKSPSRLVKDIETGKIVGTHKRGVGFHPSPDGEELGYEYHPTSIPYGTKFGGTEIGDFDYEDDDFGSSGYLDENFGELPDSTLLSLKRRAPALEELIQIEIDSNSSDDFKDEFEYADNIISWVADGFLELPENQKYLNDYDNIVDFLKSNYGDVIMSQYEENDEEDNWN